MPDLHFQVAGAGSDPDGMAPQLLFTLRIRNREAGERIQTINLRCQIRIDPTQRRYSDEEKARLRDLFGEPQQWGQTLRSMTWAHCNLTVMPFQDQVEVDLPVPCTFDFNVAGTKYFEALADSHIALTFLFSGTVFYQSDNGILQVAQIPWENEAGFRLPVQVWHDMMAHYYPNTAWLTLRKDVFDRLHQYKRQQGIPTWEQVVEILLHDTERSAPEGEQT